ncbi:ATP-binding cassette domain-containing protein, partial [Achromobacter aegrifaciens]|uniref:ATP-binding cassette domain-containing protein n=1 Tax=Achromobacter aegrifaciens TaxID=1287736 RepID=UPI001FCACEEF
MAEPLLVVQAVSKTYHRDGQAPHLALDGIDCQLGRGEVMVVVGPSGSGKSTLLRTLNGLESIDSGAIRVDGVSLTDPATDVNRWRTEVGMVFQHFNLFQHRTALDNVALPQRVVRGRAPPPPAPDAPAQHGRGGRRGERARRARPPA